MAISNIFTNRSQAVRLPAETRFPDNVKKAGVRVRGQERVIAPADAAWNSFFDAGQTVTDDFMAERVSLS